MTGGRPRYNSASGLRRKFPSPQTDRRRLQRGEFFGVGIPRARVWWVVFLAADQANGPDVCTVGAHSGRIARRCLGAVFEVTAFDGWSLRSTAKTALETWPGWKSTSEERPHSMTVSRHWKKLKPKIQTLEKRDSGQGAKSSGVQPEQSAALSKLCGRPDRTACALVLAGCCRRRRHRGGW